VGNLVGLLVLRRFLEDGHKIIIVTGGGTGMIGDPGGKSEERNLLDEETIQHNSRAVAAQIRKVFGGGDFIEENNAKWLGKLDLLEFLRDVGKHFTVNAMIKKDMVRERLEKEAPISFTEFSYSLLQGYDFLHLNEEYGCDVQVGGSDQWSNILAGVEFIRRKANKTVFAFTWPLVVNKSTGKKFGKSESGAIWLDPEKTSPFEFYQFWLNTDDDVVEEYLLKMSMLNTVEIDAVMELQKRDAKEHHGQKLLARAVTILVHGEQRAEECEQISQILFGEGNIEELDEKALAALRAAAPTCAVSEGQQIIDVLVASKLAESKREARKFIDDAAVTLNGTAVSADQTIASDDFKNGIALLKRGKRNVCVLIFG
jgi:tyrosyl-tRNA synthetase